MGRNLGAVSLFEGGGKLGPHVTQCGLGQGHLCTKWHLDASSRLATINMGRKVGAVLHLGGAGSHLTQCAWAQAYLRTKSHLDPCSRLPQQTLAENWEGGCSPF